MAATTPADRDRRPVYRNTAPNKRYAVAHVNYMTLTASPNEGRLIDILATASFRQFPVRAMLPSRIPPTGPSRRKVLASEVDAGHLDGLLVLCCSRPSINWNLTRAARRNSDSPAALRLLCYGIGQTQQRSSRNGGRFALVGAGHAASH